MDTGDRSDYFRRDFDLSTFSFPEQLSDAEIKEIISTHPADHPQIERIKASVHEQLAHLAETKNLASALKKIKCVSPTDIHNATIEDLKSYKIKLEVLLPALGSIDRQNLEVSVRELLEKKEAFLEFIEAKIEEQLFKVLYEKIEALEDREREEEDLVDRESIDGELEKLAIDLEKHDLESELNKLDHNVKPSSSKHEVKAAVWLAVVRPSLRMMKDSETQIKQDFKEDLRSSIKKTLGTKIDEKTLNESIDDAFKEVESLSSIEVEASPKTKASPPEKVSPREVAPVKAKAAPGKVEQKAKPMEKGFIDAAVTSAVRQGITVFRKQMGIVNLLKLSGKADEIAIDTSIRFTVSQFANALRGVKKSEREHLIKNLKDQISNELIHYLPQQSSQIKKNKARVENYMNLISKLLDEMVEQSSATAISTQKNHEMLGMVRQSSQKAFNQASIDTAIRETARVAVTDFKKSVKNPTVKDKKRLIQEIHTALEREFNQLLPTQASQVKRNQQIIRDSKEKVTAIVNGLLEGG